DGLPPRVKDLARTITANIRNPYDRAIAIDTYLRGYTETYNIAAPPLNADAVDYFLFIQKAGNSDYFASAMVVLLRAAGVPARVASGYALGEFDQETSSFNVKLSDAHSWPEVYFPSYGWVIFEPSPSYKPIPRGLPLPLAPNEENASGSSGGGISDEELFDLLNVPPPTTDQFVLPKPDDSVAHLFISILTKIALAIGALIGLLATIYAIVFLIWQSNFLGLSYEAGVYERMTRLGRLAWAGPNPQQTPNEYASALARATQLRHGEVAAVADGYAKARYGKGLSPGDRERVEQSWRKVRSALIKRTFWRMNPVNVVRRGE
ncbi:MAG: transglutaminase domain-containing protein, partial [Chloroflexi bacterium]|nr:transglutaminase domain-containing protein [Chloroflexota bacterium]